MTSAFAEICRSYLAGMPATGNRPHVSLVLDINTYMGDTYGGCHTHRGDPINVDTARRIMCDSDINLVLANGLIPLAMGGTTRIFTTYQYRAMVIRDGGCRRCGASPEQCESHHIGEWVKDQGPTDLDQGILVCRGDCHRDLHEHGWTVEGNANQTVTFKTHKGLVMHQSKPKQASPRHKRQRKATEDDILIQARIQELIDHINSHKRETSTPSPA